jgi:twitching motility protein PilT
MAVASPPQTVTLHQLLKAMVEKGASDLHVTTGSPPQLRIDGDLVPFRVPPLGPVETKQLCYSVLTDSQKHQFEEKNELDLSFSVQKLSRFRGNVFVQRGNVAGAFRAIPFKIKSFEDLSLPKIVSDLAEKPRGLILVTGPTGSGKSTTLATMIDKINNERNDHIVTIEDPIEYLHHHKGCVVNQREVGADTSSFKNALKYILRQDPDVVLIGELRDLETIEAALTIAETGHLVFATLHTNSTYESINRIVDVFPADQQRQILTQLSFTLQGVVTQQLIPRSRGAGRVMVSEVLVCTQAIRAVVREGKTHQIYSLMQAGQKFGMQTMNMALHQAVLDKNLSGEDALDRSMDRVELEGMLSKVLRAAA